MTFFIVLWILSLLITAVMVVIFHPTLELASLADSIVTIFASAFFGAVLAGYITFFGYVIHLNL